MKDKIVILFDLDGVLCVGECWTPADCLLAKPIEKNIAKINKLSLRKFVVIYTARRDELIPATLEWLRRNNVRYHAFSNLKCPADLYIDDKSIRPEELKK